MIERKIPNILTARELEIMNLIRDGVTRNLAIAKELKISAHTIKNHLESMYSKLAYESETEQAKRLRVAGTINKKICALIVAIELGIVEPFSRSIDLEETEFYKIGSANSVNRKNEEIVEI